MAPDLNSVPPSPKPRGLSTTAAASAPAAGNASSGNAANPTASPTMSGQGSQAMAPPPIPATSPSVPAAGAVDNTGVGAGPGPLRHPRPLTISDLHLELEKEQEAVVNRLTRELSALRQQTASVASTTSSASTNLNDSTDPHQTSTSSSSVPSRRNRSSSTLSSRSFAGGSSLPIGGGVTSIAPSRDSGPPSSSRPSLEFMRGNLSYDASVASRRQSGATSPSLSSSFQHYGEHLFASYPHSHSHRSSQSAHPSPNIPMQGGSTGTEGSQRGSISAAHAAARYEEISLHRAELETAKKENDSLRRRVRELEAMIRECHHRPRSHERSLSTATASSLAAELRDTSISDDNPTQA